MIAKFDSFHAFKVAGNIVGALVIFLTLSADAYAVSGESYADYVYLTNGDRITGDLKELDRGKLRVKTATMDTIYLNWVDVEHIESQKYLRIVNTNGTFRYGRLKKTDTPQTLGILDDGQLVELPIQQVAAVRPLRVDESLWRRLEGDARGGFDYKKGSDVLNINIASNIRLREELYELGFAFEWNEISRTENNDSSRSEIQGDYTRFRKNRWFWRGTLAFESNDELGIDLRTIGSGTIGRYLIQTSTRRFEVNAGLAASHENRTGSQTVDSLEGVLRSSFDIFVLNIPVTRLTASVDLFPGITEKDRLRVNTNVTLRNEIVRDLFWDLQFYSTYDNQPPQGAQQRDYGIITSIGATF
jgi:hypothetical protein